MEEKPDLTGNRWFNRKNRKLERLNRFYRIDERDLIWSFILQKNLFFSQICGYKWVRTDFLLKKSSFISDLPRLERVRKLPNAHAWC